MDTKWTSASSCAFIIGTVLAVATIGHAQVLGDHLQFSPINNGQPQQQNPGTTTTNPSSIQGFVTQQDFNAPQQNFNTQQTQQPSFNTQQTQQPLYPQQQSFNNQPSQQTAQPSVDTQFPGQNPTFSQPQQPLVQQALPQQYREIIAGSERFALDLFSRTVDALKTLKYNFILSPFSIWSLLTLTAEGARGNTFQELKRVLGLSDDFYYTREVYRQFQNALSVNLTTVELKTTQVMYSDVNRPIDPEYERNIETYYNTDQVPVNFLDVQTSLQTINNHIRQATNGRIEKILTKDDLEDATLILASTIFFRGMWKMPFNRSRTQEALFYDDNGVETGRVQMMFQRGAFPFTAIAELDSHILELPYGVTNRLSMIILLPRKGVSLASVTSRLGSFGLQRIYDELNKSAREYEDDEVEVFLPRFSITADFTLNTVLEQMGIMDVFSASHADLSKISRSPIYLSRLLHKAKIEVNEEGTVASAATAGTFANKATPPRFMANRPFAYLIVDKLSNLLLFCGQAEDPSKF